MTPKEDRCSPIWRMFQNVIVSALKRHGGPGVTQVHPGGKAQGTRSASRVRTLGWFQGPGGARRVEGAGGPSPGQGALEGSGGALPEPPLIWAGDKVRQTQASSRDQLPGLQRPEAAAQVLLFALRRDGQATGAASPAGSSVSFLFLRPSVLSSSLSARRGPRARGPAAIPARAWAPAASCRPAGGWTGPRPPPVTEVSSR